jgi:hypothetical protein
VIILRSNDWSLARNGVGGLIVFSLVLLAATMLHWTRLRPYHPTTLVWLAIYYVPPLALPILFRIQQLHAMPELDTHAVAPAWQKWIVGRSVVYSLVAVAGFVLAGQLSALWPWPADPLDLRVFMGQLALNAWGGFIALADGFVWRRQRTGFLLVALLGLVQLVGIALGQATYAWSSALGLVLPLMFFEWSATGFALLATYGWRDGARGAPAPAATAAL